MSKTKRSTKRPYGTGSIFEHNGSVTFRFRPVPGKPQVQRKLCRVGELNAKQQEAKAREVMAEYKPASDDEVPTVTEAGIRHINQLEHDGKARSYIKNRRGVLKNHVTPHIGDRKVDAIKVRDLNRMKTTMQQEGYGPTVIVSAFWLVSGIMGYAMSEEWRTDNPVASVAMPEIERDKEQITYLTMQEVDKVILAVCEDDVGNVERPMYRIAQQTGMRRGELIAIKWNDCDFDLEVFRVHENYVEGEFKSPKGRKSRLIPMTPVAKLTLEAWRAATKFSGDDDLVFGHPLTGEPFRPEFVSKRFKATLLRAKVGPVEMRPYKIRGKIKMKPFPLLKLHDLRDTFGTYQMMNPKNAPREVQEWLGHANLATTSDRYSQFRPLTDAAERMASSFDDARSSTGAQSQETSQDLTEPQEA